jgi:hypothetical protein
MGNGKAEVIVDFGPKLTESPGSFETVQRLGFRSILFSPAMISKEVGALRRIVGGNRPDPSLDKLEE